MKGLLKSWFLEGRGFHIKISNSFPVKHLQFQLSLNWQAFNNVTCFSTNLVFISCKRWSWSSRRRWCRSASSTSSSSSASISSSPTSHYRCSPLGSTWTMLPWLVGHSSQIYVLSSTTYGWLSARKVSFILSVWPFRRGSVFSSFAWLWTDY